MNKLRRVPTTFRLAILPAGLLIVAAAFSIAQGQPPPADRASGVTVATTDIEQKATESEATDINLGTAVVPVNGKVFRYDLATGQRTAIALPKGEVVRSISTLPAGTVVFTTNPKKHSSAFLVRDKKPLVRLGAATAVVPDRRNKAQLWRQNGKLAEQITLDGKKTGAHLTVPLGYRLVGNVRAGLVASTSADTPLIRRSAKYRTVLLQQAKAITPLSEYTAVAVRNELLLEQRDGGLAVFNATTKKVKSLPRLAAISINGLASFSPDGTRFAAVGQMGRYQRLIVGSLDAQSADEVRVVALSEDTFAPLSAPVWPTNNGVVGFRADGKLVLFQPGATEGLLISTEPEQVTEPVAMPSK